MMDRLENVLHREIPLTRQIGIKVVDFQGDSLTLAAPLECNVIHKCTAFGGSLYAVSVLSGWGLIYLLLRQQGLSGHIVIQESHTRFLKPVVEEISASCAFDSPAQKEGVVKMFKRKGVARVKLKAKIRCNGELAVLFEGSYVIHS